MNLAKKDIAITIVHEGREYALKTTRNEYRNLMVLLNNSIYLENFGECGGMGRCATCLVEVAGLKGNSLLMQGNEMATIAKTGCGGTNLRLACQLLISEDLNESVVDIAGEGY